MGGSGRFLRGEGPLKRRRGVVLAPVSQMLRCALETDVDRPVSAGSLIRNDIPDCERECEGW